MRAVLAIALMFAGSFIVATVAYKDPNYPHFFKHRTKLREIRGFKPEYISTAIGFGKRDSPVEAPDLHGRERDLLSALRNLPRVMSADALLRMMQTNPALVSKLTQLQNDQGDQEDSMTELSRTGRTFALF